MAVNKVAMRIGALRHLVQLMDFVKVSRDGFGQEEKQWTVVASLWCSINPVIGREYEALQQLHADVTHKIEMRYLSPKPTPIQRLQYKDEVSGQIRVFEILSVLDTEERHFKLELIVKELVSVT